MGVILGEERYGQLARLRRLGTIGEAERRLLERQDEYDRGAYGFFGAYLTGKQCEMMEFFKGYQELIIRGGVRSAKTFFDDYAVCCRVGNWYPAGYVPYRTEWDETIYRPVLERKVLPGTREVASVWISVLTRLLGAAPGGMQQTLLQMLPKPWIRSIHTVGGIYVTSIELVNGGEIAIKSADAGRESYQSAALDLLVCDEGHRQEIISEATSRSGSYPLKFIYSYFPIPEEGTTWAHEAYVLPEIEHRSPPWRKVVTVNYMENTLIPKPQRDRQAEIWKANGEYHERVFGEFGEIRGRVYREFKRGTHVINAMNVPELKANGGEPPDGWLRFAGIDCHNSRKGCAAIMCAIDPKTGRGYYYNEYQSDGDPYTWFEYFNRLHSEHPFEMVWIDNSAYSTDAHGFSIGEKFEEMTGLPIEKANKDRAHGIRAVQLRLQVLRGADGGVVDGLPGIMICEHCYNAIRQMEQYARKSDNFSDVCKVNDEYCDCIRYIEIAEPHKFFGATESGVSLFDGVLEEDHGNPFLRTV